jgi:predicted nucleotidyltransferase
MLTQEQILVVLRQNKPFFSKELGIMRIGLFGSYAKGQQKKDSDIDVMIEMTEPNWSHLCKVWDILENQLKTKVDLIRKGPHLRGKFLQAVEKEIIYA